MDELDRSVIDWISRFAERLGAEPPTADEIDAVLKLAAIAAHAAQRQAAPLACWLVGRCATPLEDALTTATAI